MSKYKLEKLSDNLDFSNLGIEEIKDQYFSLSDGNILEVKHNNDPISPFECGMWGYADTYNSQDWRDSNHNKERIERLEEAGAPYREFDINQDKLVNQKMIEGEHDKCIVYIYPEAMKHWYGVDLINMPEQDREKVLDTAVAAAKYWVENEVYSYNVYDKKGTFLEDRSGLDGPFGMADIIDGISKAKGEKVECVECLGKYDSIQDCINDNEKLLEENNKTKSHIEKDEI